MNNEPNNYLSQEAPRWMRDMFQELSDMFAELLPDADTLNLEEMQRRLDELEQPPMTAAEQPFHRPMFSEGKQRCVVDANGEVMQ
jgi:hypothetical protein